MFSLNRITSNFGLRVSTRFSGILPEMRPVWAAKSPDQQLCGSVLSDGIPIRPDPSWPRWQHGIREAWTVWVRRQGTVLPGQGGHTVLWRRCLQVRSTKFTKERTCPPIQDDSVLILPLPSPELVGLCDHRTPPAAGNKNTCLAFTRGLPAPSGDQGPPERTARRR